MNKVHLVSSAHSFLHMLVTKFSGNFNKQIKKKIQATSTNSILEPFAASGIRSIRFATEVPNVDRVVCNDLSVDAFKSMNLNIAHNRLKHVIQAENKNAR